MNYSKISVRYSKAFYELALEKNSLDNSYADILIIEKALEIQEVKSLLLSPIVKKTNKINAIIKIFEKHISEISLSFLKLILENGRENNLLDIIRNFKDKYKKNKGIMSAFFTTNVEIDEDFKSKILIIAKNFFNSDVEITYNTNPKIIGGYILRVDDKQIDASISSKLIQLKRNLINTTFEYKLPN